MQRHIVHTYSPTIVVGTCQMHDTYVSSMVHTMNMDPTRTLFSAVCLGIFCTFNVGIPMLMCSHGNARGSLHVTNTVVEPLLIALTPCGTEGTE